MIQHYNDKALKLFILIESSNMFHWKPAKKKIKVVVVLGENLGQSRSNIVKKVKKKTGIIGQNWQKDCFQSSHLTVNPVFPKNEALHSHSLLMHQAN